MSDLAILPQATVELPSTLHKNKDSLQSDLKSVLASYAALYPNPRLAQERLDRESLIRALAAAGEAIERNPAPSKKSLWGRLFGQRTPEPDVAVLRNFDERRLKYVNPDDKEDHDLCGTENYSLDVSCIPPEAYMVARFRIASRHRKINLARNTWLRAGSTVVVIAGLGRVVEIPTDGSSPGASGNSWMTSDCRDLETHVRREGWHFEPEMARACLIGPYFMVISWGLPDGMIVCYRKTKRQGNKTPGWQNTACIGPTESVRSSLADMFSEQHGLPTSPLLTVTDIVALVVETGSESVPDVSLALSRLGGYIELVPLPSSLWYGTEIAPRKQSASRGGKRYCAALVDLSTRESVSSRIISIPTTEYHADIIGLEAIRTRVNDDTLWNQDVYPDRPPAEHILIAHGRYDGSNTEQLSFWAVSTLYAENSGPKDGVAFHLHASLAEAIDLGAITPPASVFANDEILRYWRKPREIELREDTEISEEAEEDDHVATISIPMPLLEARSSSTARGTLLAILDSSGGVGLLDCSLLERLVSQNLSEDERHRVLGGDPVPLADFVLQRTQVSRTLSASLSELGQSNLLQVKDVHFFPESMVGTEPVLAFLTRQSVITASLRELRQGAVTTSVDLFDDCRDSVVHVGSERSLTVFASDLSGSSLNSFSITSLRTGYDLVERMIRGGNDLGAVRAAESLGPNDRARLEPHLVFCRKRLWEDHAHVESFLSIRDESYQLDQVWAASEGRLSAVNSAVNAFDIVRQVAEYMMERLRKASVATTVAILGTENSESVIRRIRQRYILLGTYEIVSLMLGNDPSIEGFAQDFLPTPLPEISQAFAVQGSLDILSVMYFRHTVEIGLGFIAKLPLSLYPDEYQHLLPVVPLPEDEHLFFISGESRDDLKTLDTLEGRIRGQFGVEVWLSSEELSIIGLEFESVLDNLKQSDHTELETIYAERACQIDASCGSLDMTISFCESALRSLRRVTSPASEATFRLRSIRSNAHILAGIIAGSVSNNTAHVAALTAAEFAKFSCSDLLDYVLRIDLSPDVLMGVISDQVRRRMAELTSDSEVDLSALLIQACSRLISSSTQLQDLVEAIRSVRTVCRLSNASLREDRRLLQNPGQIFDLIRIVIDGILAKSISISNKNSTDSSTYSQMIDNLWQMYECLPASLETEDSSLDAMVDKFKHILTIGDIAARWPGCDFLGTWRRQINSPNKQIEIEPRDEIVRQLCDACLRQYVRDSAPTAVQARCMLAEVLVLDVREIFSMSNKGGEEELLTRTLFVPFLQKMQVPVLRHLHMVFGADLFQHEAAQSALVAFTNGAVFSTEGQQNIEAAIACEDTLCEFYPELQSHFQSIRKFLEVAHFINSVILQSVNDYMKPSTVTESEGLEVIDYLLEKHPGAVVKDCEEWIDEDYSTRANEQFRASQNVGGSGSVGEPLPRLPGMAVFHLAELLGLVDDASVVLVKSLVIENCVKLGHFGAAAAICITIFPGTSLDAATVSRVLEVAALIVNQSEFKDNDTKFEICLKILTSFSPTALAKSETLRDNKMDTIISKLSELLNDSPGPIRILSMLHPAASKEIESLLRSFAQASVRQRAENTLLVPLARAVLNAFVAAALSPEPGASPLGRDSLTSLLDLGLVLLCHSSNVEGSTQCLEDIAAVLESSRDMFEDEIDVTMAAHADEEIVRKLVGMGYLELGARRAAVMTGNVSFNEALCWAVAHSMEPGFNDPIVVLRNPKMKCDAALYKSATAKISSTRDGLTGKTSMDGLFAHKHKVVHSGEADSGRYTSKLGSTNTASCGGKGQPSMKDVENMKKPKDTHADAKPTVPKDDTKSTKSPSPSNGRGDTPLKRIGQVTPSTKQPPDSNVVKKTPSKNMLTLGHVSSVPTSSTQSKKEVLPTLSGVSTLEPKPSPSVVLPNTSAIRSIADGEVSPFLDESTYQAPSHPKMKSSSGSPSRSALRQMGLDTLKAARSTGGKGSGINSLEDRTALRQIGRETLKSFRTSLGNGKPNEIDRQRLLEEGRRILQMSRPDTTRTKLQTPHSHGRPPGLHSPAALRPPSYDASPIVPVSRNQSENVAKIETQKQPNLDGMSTEASGTAPADSARESSNSWDFEEDVLQERGPNPDLNSTAPQAGCTATASAGPQFGSEKASSGWDFDEDTGSDGAEMQDEGWGFDDDV